MIYRNAETESLNLINVGYILQQRSNNMIRSALCYDAAHCIQIRKLTTIITAGSPFQLVKVNSIGNTEILEGTKQLSINRFGQPNLSCDPAIEIWQDTLAVHTLRGSC